MSEKVLVRIHTIQSVFVGTYPAAPLAVNKGASDTGLTNTVLLVEFIAHIIEF